MTGRTECFLSLKTIQGRGVLFGHGNKGYILGVGKIKKSLDYVIANLYCESGLKYILFSASQIYDKSNGVKFPSDCWSIASL